MAGATVVGVVASDHASSSWYIDALHNSGATVERFQVDSYGSRAVKSEVHRLSSTLQHCNLRFTNSADQASGLPPDPLILFVESNDDSYYKQLTGALSEYGRNDFQILAASLSEKSIFVAGTKKTFNAYLPLLQRPGVPLFHVSEDLSSVGKLRLIHNHLLGIHTVAAAEAMGLAARAGLNTSQLYSVLIKAAGNSSAFETRAKKMLAADWAPECALRQATDQIVSIEDNYTTSNIAI